MITSREFIKHLIELGRIPAHHLAKALAIIGVYPSGNSWLRFLDLLCLVLGAVAMGLAAIFFVAYNWSEMGRFAKFALIEILIVVGVVLYCWFERQSLVGRMSLLISALFLGALMALFGQTYQTGADPWQLFFNWALLILPWALIGRFAALWLLWLGLMNITIPLYLEASGRTFGTEMESFEIALWCVFILDALAWVIWDFLSRYVSWLRARWAIRIIAVVAGTIITYLAVFAIVVESQSYIGILVWLAWVLAVLYIYRRVMVDLFMLAGACLSIIVTINSVIWLRFEDTMGLLGLGHALLIIGLGVVASIWLKSVHKEIQS